MLAASVLFGLDTSILGRFTFPSLLTSSPSFSGLGSMTSNFDDGDDDDTNDDADSKLSSSAISFYRNHLCSHGVAIIDLCFHPLPTS